MPFRWVPSQVGYFNLKVDNAILSRSSYEGIGCIICNNLSEIMRVMAYKKNDNVTTLESWTMWYGLQMVAVLSKHKLQRIGFEI